MISVPVTIGFDNAKVIGYCCLDSTKLPATSQFVLSLAIKVVGEYTPGEIPNKPYYGEYELLQLGVVKDDDYIAYLKQIGKL